MRGVVHSLVPGRAGCGPGGRACAALHMLQPNPPVAMPLLRRLLQPGTCLTLAVAGL